MTSNHCEQPEASGGNMIRFSHLQNTYTIETAELDRTHQQKATHSIAAGSGRRKTPNE